MIDLMSALGGHYPTVQAVCHGDPTVYANIVWVAGDSLPSETDLNSAYDSDVRAAKVTELSVDCQNDIIQGFSSSALGSAYWYDGQNVDQINLLGAKSSTESTSANPNGTTFDYACRAIDANGVVSTQKNYVTHTHDQLCQVVSDGANVKLTKLQKFNTKRNYVNDPTTTLDQVAAVTWDSNP